MLYRTLARLIERGQTEGLEEKLDIFFAAGKLSQAEYTALIAALHPPEKTAEETPETADGADGGAEETGDGADGGTPDTAEGGGSDE